MLKSLSKITALCPRLVFALRYYRWSKKIINWSHPSNIQEFSMCQLFDKDTSVDFYAMLADKVRVRDYVKERIGESYITQFYGTWESADDIDFEKLPDRFVLKTNNGCATNIIVKNKAAADIPAIRKQLKVWLQYPYGELTGQIQYSRIKPLILAEEYLEQEKGVDSLPNDYKFFCINGKPVYILYYDDRKLNGHVTPNMLFDLKWNPIPEAVNRPVKHDVPCPKSLELMIKLAEKLSEGLKFVRVDFYEINNSPVFGEMTLTPDVITNIRTEFTPLMQAHLHVKE